jgi:hypothetical protein
MSNPEQQDRLERWVGDLLHRQPPLSAPDALQARVMHHLARNAGRWWRQGFVYWPLSARALLLLLACGSMGLTFLLSAALRAAIGPVAAVAALPEPVAGLIAALGVRSAEIRDLWLALSGIAPDWLEGAVALGATLYVALFALLTIGYRTLYVERSSPQ